MAIYHLQDGQFIKVSKTSFSSEGVREQQHLQAALKKQIEVVAPECLVIAEEFSEWSDSQRRIDLLAVDRQANLVVIELKRTETGGHMELQAIRYAAMVSTLTFKQAVDIFQKYLNDNKEEQGSQDELNAEAILMNFLGWEEPLEEDFASDVRIILVSSDFSKELTTSVMWLNERNLDIRCVRLIPHSFGDKMLIDAQQIIPLPESESYQVKIRQKSEERRAARESSKDYTRYLFGNESLNKRKLVLAVIHKWVANNNPQSYEDLLAAFPQDTRPGGMFVSMLKAREIYESQGVDRHFLKEGEAVTFPDSSEYAISNQWGKNNIQKFIDCARRLGYEIEEAE